MPAEADREVFAWLVVAVLEGAAVLEEAEAGMGISIGGGALDSLLRRPRLG